RKVLAHDARELLFGEMPPRRHQGALLKDDLMVPVVLVEL
ncbi:MAG: hypothetical protein ACJAQ3_000864, partial [Planctomycetota bacterium]